MSTEIPMTIDRLVTEAAGDTHTAAEVLIRIATRMWLAQANNFGSQVADEFIDALVLDMRDRAKIDGASVRSSTSH